MSEKQRKLLCEIQALEFTCCELNLYLDTHPGCDRALEDYNCYSNKLRQLIDRYTCDYGQFMNFGVGPTSRTWTWPKSPWPWEM